MVDSYELDKVVKMCVFMVSSMLFSGVPISFLWKAIILAKYCVTVSSGDGREGSTFAGLGCDRVSLRRCQGGP